MKDAVDAQRKRWAAMYPEGRLLAATTALASIVRDIIRDEDFYFEIEENGYTHLDGHLRLTPQQIAAVMEVQDE